MKVIVAGLSKTGTKTMQAALNDLGYSVYDFLENFLYLGDDWIKICKHGGTTEDFRRMFENVDAVTDLPGCYFWDEIHKAFPESKIILTMRDNEDVWLNSFEKQVEKNTSLMSVVGICLSPTLAKMTYFGKCVSRATVASGFHKPWYRPLTGIINKTTLCMVYRRHNSHVLQAAPKNKLLVFNVKDGWKPLCQFLGVDVPNKPFPHKNVNGQMIEELMKTLPLFQRIKREMLISTSLLSVLFGFGIYKVIKSGKSAMNCDMLNVMTSYFKLK